MMVHLIQGLLMIIIAIIVEKPKKIILIISFIFAEIVIIYYVINAKANMNQSIIYLPYTIQEKRIEIIQM